MKKMQRTMYGHGVLMIACTLLFGVGYWMKLVGGFEVIPNFIWHFDVPGTVDGWRRAHTGPVMNGLMVIAVGVAAIFMSFGEKWGRILAWIVILDGWSNVVFYFFGNFAPSRGLSFGPNQFGESNIFGIIALGPAYLFGVLNLIALIAIGVNVLKSIRNRRSDTHSKSQTASV